MQTPIHILIIEDEAAIRNGLIDVFVYHGFAVDSAADGKTGLEKALSGRFDLMVLDVMLPGINGFEICQRIREQDRDQAIIMLTAKTTDQDIIEGLSLGADDYVGKPFSVAQLVLRVQAVLRRSMLHKDLDDDIRLTDDIRIDCRNFCGKRAEIALTFSRREIEILQHLKANHQRPVSRDELLSKVWGYDNHLQIETRTVDIHIAKLRRKIEPDSTQPRFLITVRGAGYRLIVQDQEHG